MASQRKAGALLGYANILAKNLVNLVYTPMLLSYVGQADYGVFQSSNSFVFSLTLLSFGFSEAYVRFYTQTVAHGGERDIRHLNGMYLTLYVAVTAAAVALGMGFSANAGAVFSAGFTEAQVSLARELLAIMTLNVASTLFHRRVQFLHHGARAARLPADRQLVTTLATPLCAWALRPPGMGPWRCPSTARGEPRPARPQRALRHRRAGHALRAQGCRLGRHARHRRLQCLDLR